MQYIQLSSKEVQLTIVLVVSLHCLPRLGFSNPLFRGWRDGDDPIIRKGLFFHLHFFSSEGGWVFHIFFIGHLYFLFINSVLFLSSFSIGLSLTTLEKLFVLEWKFSSACVVSLFKWKFWSIRFKVSFRSKAGLQSSKLSLACLQTASYCCAAIYWILSLSAIHVKCFCCVLDS